MADDVRWVMRVKCGDNRYIEVGTTRAGDPPVVVQAGNTYTEDPDPDHGRGWCHLTIAEAKMMRLYLARAIREAEARDAADRRSEDG